jgi:hypothetical protein
MSEPHPLPYARKPRATEPAESLLVSIISAGLFLYVGFGMGLEGISGNAIHDGSVDALVWGARIVGFGILIATAMSYFRVPGAALLDLVLAVLATGGCLGVGAIWLVYSDQQGFLLVLFGLLNGSAARGAWRRWLARREPQPPGER